MHLKIKKNLDLGLLQKFSVSSFYINQKKRIPEMTNSSIYKTNSERLLMVYSVPD